jgi:small conductance mechanosensitive channel
LRTKANQQWAAMRETQRRIRLALEEHHLLPGDPLRVFGSHGANVLAAGAANETKSQKPDPTAAKPNEASPFESS